MLVSKWCLGLKKKTQKVAAKKVDGGEAEFHMTQAIIFGGDGLDIVLTACFPPVYLP